MEINPYQPPESTTPVAGKGQFRIIPSNDPRKLIPRLAILLAVLVGACCWRQNWDLLTAGISLSVIGLLLSSLVSWQQGRWISANLPGLPGGARYGGRVQSRTRSGTRGGYLFVCPGGLYFSWHPGKAGASFTQYAFDDLEAVKPKAGSLNLEMKSGKLIKFRTGSAGLWANAIRKMRSLPHPDP